MIQLLVVNHLASLLPSQNLRHLFKNRLGPILIAEEIRDPGQVRSDSANPLLNLQLQTPFW